MPKQKKQLEQVNGQFEPKTARNLDQFFGDTGFSKYSHNDEAVYIDYLENLGTTDLQTHATSVQEFPINNRTMLIKRLVTRFRKHWASYAPLPKIEPNPGTKLNDQALKALSEGK